MRLAIYKIEPTDSSWHCKNVSWALLRPDEQPNGTQKRITRVPYKYNKNGVQLTLLSTRTHEFYIKDKKIINASLRNLNDTSWHCTNIFETPFRPCSEPKRHWMTIRATSESACIINWPYWGRERMNFILEARKRLTQSLDNLNDKSWSSLNRFGTSFRPDLWPKRHSNGDVCDLEKWCEKWCTVEPFTHELYAICCPWVPLRKSRDCTDMSGALFSSDYRCFY
jgi:hypothetical protein